MSTAERASEVSSASERANGQASGPLLQSGFLVILDNSAMIQLRQFLPAFLKFRVSLLAFGFRMSLVSLLLLTFLFIFNVLVFSYNFLLTLLPCRAFFVPPFAFIYQLCLFFIRGFFGRCLAVPTR